MNQKICLRILLALTPVALLTVALALPSLADAQTPAPRRAAPPRKAPGTAPRKAPPATKKRATPVKRAAPKPRTVTARRAAPKRVTPPRKPASPPKPSKVLKTKKAKQTKTKKKKKTKSKPPVARFYLGADLSFFPSTHTKRQVVGLGAESMPNNTAIRQIHGSSLRFIQGLQIMNGAMDLRFGVGVSNLIPVGGKRALWGSDFGMSAGVRIHRFKRFDLQIFNGYRLLVTSGLDRDHNGIGLHLEVGVGGTYHIDKRHRMEFRLGYCHQQLRYHTKTDAQVGGLETPSGVTFKSHMIVLSFAFLHFR